MRLIRATMDPGESNRKKESSAHQGGGDRTGGVLPAAACGAGLTGERQEVPYRNDQELRVAHKHPGNGMAEMATDVCKTEQAGDVLQCLPQFGHVRKMSSQMSQASS